MVKKTLAASIEYCCRYELKAIWLCSKNAHWSSGLEPSKVSGAWMWDWLVVGGLGGGMAIFWPIASSACTNCWTGSIVLVDSCAEAGGDCCRVGGVHKLCNGGVCGWWFLLAFEVQCHWFTLFQGISVKQDFSIVSVSRSATHTGACRTYFPRPRTRRIDPRSILRDQNKGLIRQPELGCKHQTLVSVHHHIQYLMCIYTSDQHWEVTPVWKSTKISVSGLFFHYHSERTLCA